jgi:hypothetical protein
MRFRSRAGKVAIQLILLLLPLSGCVHAQGSWSVPASGTGTIGPGTGGIGPPPPCTINPISLPGGTVGTAYPSTQLTASNCVAPLAWSVSVGSLPSGLSLSSGGLISGTPSGAGTSAFTVTLLDNAGNAPTFPLSTSIVSNTVPGTPLAPDSALTSWDTSVAGTPTSNITDCVGTPVNASILPGGGCATSFAGSTAGLQAALNAVSCGHVVNVAALSGGVTIPYGAITLPSNKKCANNAWIWLTGDLSDPTFPTEGTRVDPCYVGIPQSAQPHMPYSGADLTPSTCARHIPQIITTATTNNPPIRLSIPSSGTNTPSIGHWRIQRLQCARDQSADALTVGCIDFGFQPAAAGQDCALTGSGNTALPANAAQCATDQPDHIVVAQIVSLSDPIRQTVRAIAMGGTTFIAIKDSWIQDIQSSFAGGLGDAQSFAGGFGHGYTGVGDWLFQNNLSASSTEGTIFCGAFTEPTSPVTNKDGVPSSVIWNHDWFYKPILWDTQRGQTNSETLVNEGITYPPQSDQEINWQPTTVQVQQGTSFNLNNTWINDSAGGWNRFNIVGTAPNVTGTATIDGAPCVMPSTTTVGTTAVGTSVIVASVAGFTINEPVSIVGAGVNGGTYSGTITGISGTTLTVSPATSTSVAAGKQVSSSICIAGADSANGTLSKANVTVGAAPWQMTNIIQWKYIACAGNDSPSGFGCTTATAARAHPIFFTGLVLDSRTANQGGNRNLSTTITITVTATAPSNQIALSPSSPDLQIQPSYSDAFGNTRNFAYVFTAALNFTSTTLSWKVDGIANGNSSVGRICSVTAIPCTAPGSNDPSVVYVSGTATGSHTISVTSAAGTTTSQAINVSTTSPIWAYDLKAMTVKNMWEAKCLNRGLLENSILENTWGSQGNGGGQNAAILNQAANQTSQTTDGSGAVVGYGPVNISDFSADHLHILHAGGGLVTAALNQGKGIHRLSYSNILMEDLNGIRYGHGFLHPQFDVFMQFSGTAGTPVLPWTSLATPLANDVNSSHITEVGGTSTTKGINSWLSIANNNAQFQLGPFSVKDSIFQVPGTLPFANNNGDIGDCNRPSGTDTESVAFLGTGYTPATPCFSTYSLARNLLIDNTSTSFVTPTIWTTPSTATDLFVNSNPNGNGDYHIKAGSQYAAGGAKDASDGTALGADIDGIAASDAIVRWGAPNPPTVDMLTVALMGTPTRLSNHMHGTVNGGSDTYSILDTDAGYPAGYPTGIFFWAKHPTGNPWDIEKYDSTYAAYHWITEDGDATDQATCVAAGFSGGCFLDPNAYKRFPTPVPLLPRNFTYGTRVTINTPGPNTFVRTTNCESTSTNVNLGDVQSVTTGPFLMTWGGTIDSGTGVVGSNGPTFDPIHGVLTFRNDYYYGGTLSSGVFNDKESTFYVPGSGRVAWFFYQLSGGTYALQQWTINNTLTSGNTTANFPCGAGKPWWP